MRNVRKEPVFWWMLVIVGLMLYFFTTVSFAGVMLGSVLVYGGIAFFLSCVCGKNIAVTVSGQAQGRKNEKLLISLTLENKSRFPMLYGKLPVMITNCLTGERMVKEFDSHVLWKRKQEKTVVLQSEYAGCLELHGVYIEVTDPLHLFVRQRPCRVKHSCYIFPSMEEMPFSEQEWNCYDMESFQYASGVRGDDSSETFGIRSYQQGDSMKAVHWKLSGKLNEYVVREWSLPVERHMMILLDKRNYGVEQNDKLTDIFLSLSHTAVLHGEKHTVGWYDYRTDCFHSYRIQDETDLYQMIPRLLQCPHVKDEESAVERFLESEEEKAFGMYFYVTESGIAEEETERLEEYGNIRIYRTE